MIEINNKKLCESCFAEIEEDGKCPHCGFYKDEYIPDAMVLPMGTKLDNKILIGRLMGKGGFGVTYLGYDLRMDKVIAVKEYYPNGIAYRSGSGTEVLVADPKSQETFDKGTEKFYTEAEMVAQFNGNPNIVGVYDYFRANNTVYLIMEYLNGVTLKSYVKKHGTINDGQALYVMDKMAAALSITHSAGVLHRDISPDNIMVCLDGKVKLIDFGAARQIMAESSSNLTVVMKPGYTPIEQYTKKGRQGAWTDIYALGASIYYAMTGKVIDDPYERMENDTEFSSNIHGINDTLWNVIKKCTMINANDRYGNAIELRKELNTVSAPLKAEPIVIESSDVKINADDTETVNVTLDNTGVIEPIEVFADSEKEDGGDEPEDYEEPAVPASTGYDPNDNVYERTKTKKPRSKKLIVGIVSAAAVIAIAVGVFLFVNRPESGTPEEYEQTAESNMPVNEEFPVKPLIHLDFETTDGLTAVVRTNDIGPNVSANYGIAERERNIIIAEGKGAVGNALYLDGTYGVDFDMVSIDDDIYTISFWFNAERAEDFMPIVQMGHNTGKSIDDTTVTWISFTKGPWGGENGEGVLPIAWNRNVSFGDDDWPWIYAMDDKIHGLNEWCLVTVVADGSHYEVEGGREHVGTQFYLNGKLMYSVEDNSVDKAIGLSSYILAGGDIEAHIGINYWDKLYKGYIDELYIFDEALNADQVKALFDMGNPS